MENQKDETMSRTDENMAYKDHAVNVLSSMNKLRQDETLCDFKILVGHKSFPVHRNMLASCCDYFRAMLLGEMRESKQGYVEMKEVESEAVEQCIEFMYTGRADVNAENVERTLQVAHLIQLQGLVEICCNQLQRNISMKNWIPINHLAATYDLKKLKERTDAFVIENFKEVIKTKEYRTRLNTSEVKQYLTLCVQHKISGYTLWTAIKKWIEYKTKTRKYQLCELLEVANMSFSFSLLVETIWNHSLVQHDQKCENILAVQILENVPSKSNRITIEDCFFVKELCHQYRGYSRVEMDLNTRIIQHFREVQKMMGTGHSSLYPDISTLFKSLPGLRSLSTFNRSFVQSFWSKYSRKSEKWKYEHEWAKEHGLAEEREWAKDNIPECTMWEAAQKWVHLEPGNQKEFPKLFACLPLNRISMESKRIMWNISYVETCKEQLGGHILSDAFFHEITLENFFFFKQLCHEYPHNQNSIEINSNLDHFISRNFQRIQLESDFKKLNAEDVLACLQSSENNSSETTKWESILKWVKHDPHIRKTRFPELFACLKLEEMPLDFIQREIRNEDLVKTIEECRDRVTDTFYAVASSKSTKQDKKVK